ncbi:DVU_1557 family redox protein [Treponema primitia]|jgi:hypothetical protein|uniref:DVU_1557 family redox protein n=1 Tax=Treponema primitia TaxID=88058 RepID=UPI0002555711|nr:CLJU_RS11820 family redox protein [Treponema primitia]
MAEEKQKPYDTGLKPAGEILCAKCGVALTLHPVTLGYMSSTFPVELPACPKCGFIYIPEELAIGRMLHVERSLEDK